MPLFGAHMSIAGGYYKAIDAAETHDCLAVQLFTKNNNQWHAKELTDAEVTLFQDRRTAAGVEVAVSHDCYLINLASPTEELYRKSLEAFIVEIERADRLGLDYLVTHPGAATDGDFEAGLVRVATALDEAHTRCPKAKVQVLLENTAGQGTSLGHRFEHLARILSLVKQPERVGVCIDTCHTFAAGYPLAPVKEYKATMAELDRQVGIEKVLCFHLNDSKKPLGSRVDRHEHLGRGCLGLEPFQLIVNDRRFKKLPMILETPKEDGDNDDMDTVNLGVLRGLLK